MRNNPQEIIDRMLHNGEAMLAAGRASQAFETYMEIVRLCPDPTAQYNLGVLSAPGKRHGAELSGGGLWFYQVSLDGDAGGWGSLPPVHGKVYRSAYEPGYAQGAL